MAYLPINNLKGFYSLLMYLVTILKALFRTSTFMANVLSIMDIAPKHGNARCENYFGIQHTFRIPAFIS